MQSSTRANLEENYRYHTNLAEFHKQRIEEAGGGNGGEGGGESPTAPPVNVDIPYLSGDGLPGGTLNCTMGNWEGTPDSYSYQWLSDGQSVKATTGGDTYQVLPEDVGHSITCVVTATIALGSTDAPESNEVMIADGQVQSDQQQQAQSAQPRPTRQSERPSGMPQRAQRATISRDETLFTMHDDVAKQLRAALDAWQDAPSQQQMREERPVVRRASRVMAREAARDTSRRATRH